MWLRVRHGWTTTAGPGAGAPARRRVGKYPPDSRAAAAARGRAPERARACDIMRRAHNRDRVDIRFGQPAATVDPVTTGADEWTSAAPPAAHPRGEAPPWAQQE